MRYLTALALLVLAVGLGACAGKKPAPQATQDLTKAETTFAHCAPNVFALLKKPARQQFVRCAVPPKNRLAFERCLTSGLIGIPTKSRIENTGLTCLGRYA